MWLYLFVWEDSHRCPGGALWHLDEGADDVAGAEEDAGALEARARDHLDRLRLDDGDWYLEHVAFVRLERNVYNRCLSNWNKKFSCEEKF